MEPDSGQLGLLHAPAEHLGDRLRVKGSLVWLSEHEVIGDYA
jgi:hypothetical protein